MHQALRIGRGGASTKSRANGSLRAPSRNPLPVERVMLGPSLPRAHGLPFQVMRPAGAVYVRATPARARAGPPNGNKFHIVSLLNYKRVATRRQAARKYPPQAVRACVARTGRARGRELAPASGAEPAQRPRRKRSPRSPKLRFSFWEFAKPLGLFRSAFYTCTRRTWRAYTHRGRAGAQARRRAQARRSPACFRRRGRRWW